MISKTTNTPHSIQTSFIPPVTNNHHIAAVGIGVIMGIGMLHKGLYSKQQSNIAIHRDLAIWIKEAEESCEYEERAQVAERITESYLNKREKLSLPYFSKLTSLPETALARLTSLQTLDLSGCSNLASFTIPDTLLSLKRLSLSGCQNLASVTIPDTLLSLEYLYLSHCSNLASVIIPHTLISLNVLNLAYCLRLTSITISNSLTSLESLSLSHCSNLASVIIPDTLTSLDFLNLSHCSNLASVIIPDTLTSLEYLYLSHCSNLASVIIPDTLTSLEYLFLSECPNLALRGLQVRSGVIEDIPEEELINLGVIVTRGDLSTTLSLANTLKKLFPSESSQDPKYQLLLSHSQGSMLASFLDRIHNSFPEYNEKICDFINLATEDKKFREDLFDGVFHANTNCHDRPLYLFSKLSALEAVYKAEKQNNPKALLSNILALHQLDIIDAYSRPIGGNEALEISLYFQLKLKKKLSLPIAITSMGNHLYAERILSQSGKSILEHTTALEKLCIDGIKTHTQKMEILSNSPFFRKECEELPKYQAIQHKYGEALDLLVGLNLNISQKSLSVSLARQALPKELENIPFDQLNQIQRETSYKTLGEMKEKELNLFVLSQTQKKIEDLIKKS